jgi:peroxiredoxin
MKRNRSTHRVLFLAFLFLNAASIANGQTETVRPLEVGAKAINFDLPIVGRDDYIELQDQYKQGPVVVVVLRGFPGYQCPLCSQQFSTLVNRAKTLTGKVHKVILVYPGEKDQLTKYAKRFLGSRRLPEPLTLVADPGMEMVRQWGLRWDKPRETAYPATYLIKSNGRVAWRKVSDSHAGRSTVDEILRELKKL